MTTSTTGVEARRPLVATSGLLAAPGRLAIGAIVGGAVISLGDHLFHVRTDVLVHHWYPQWDGQMVAVIPTFMLAAAAMLVAGRAVAADDGPPPRPLALLGDVAWFFAAYALTGQLGLDRKGACLALLVVAFAVRLLLVPDRRAVVLLGVVIALGGCLGEGAISGLGAFDYHRPDVVGVPLWLFPLYLNGAPAVLALARLTRPPGPPRSR